MNSKKKRMGRPRKPKKETRAPGISVRFTPDERKPIDEAVRASGMNQSDWARRSLLYVATNKIAA